MENENCDNNEVTEKEVKPAEYTKEQQRDLIVAELDRLVEELAEALTNGEKAGAIKGRQTLITQKERSLKRIEADIAREEAALVAEAEAAKAAKAEARIAFVAARSEDLDMHYNLQSSIVYYKEYGEWRGVPLSNADCLIPQLDDDPREVRGAIRQYLKKKERVCYEIVMTLGEVRPHQLNVLEFEIIDPINAPYDPAFDLLMHSLGDGNPEKVSYIERWILARANQIRTANLNPAYPALVFLNPEGGAGKDVLNSFLLPALVGKAATLTNTSMDRLTGRFNSQFAGKLFVGINETVMERSDGEALKRVLGSPTLTIEEKYAKPMEVDNLAAYVISGNEQNVVKLTGDKVDRRYSIIATSTRLATVLESALSDQGEVFDNEAALNDRINTIVTGTIGDRDEVAKWLYHLATKHGDLTNVEPYHGADYERAVSQQRSLIHRLIERVFCDEATKAICNRQLYKA